MDNFFERNLYVDTILREIFKYAGNRRILFSCFDPDTCAMYVICDILPFVLNFWIKWTQQITTELFFCLE